MLAKCRSLAKQKFHVVHKQLGTIDVRYHASAAVPEERIENLDMKDTQSSSWNRLVAAKVLAFKPSTSFTSPHSN